VRQGRAPKDGIWDYTRVSAASMCLNDLSAPTGNNQNFTPVPC